MRFCIGDTFDFSGIATVIVNGASVKNFTNWNATSQIRDHRNNLIATLTVTWLNTLTGAIRVRFNGSTNNWPEAKVFMNIRFFDPSGNSVTTETLQMTLFRGPTN